MNTAQKTYIQAKAVYENTNDHLNQLEAVFLASCGRNEKHIHAIDDDSVFDRLSIEFSEVVKDEYTALDNARKNLKLAENDLIAYGISIMPGRYKKEADILRSSRDVTVRQEIIGLTLRLDTRTVPQRRNSP
jgi:hypothetical protein